MLQGQPDTATARKATRLLHDWQNPWLVVIVSICTNAQVDLLWKGVRLVSCSELEYAVPTNTSTWHPQDTVWRITCLEERGGLDSKTLRLLRTWWKIEKCGCFRSRWGRPTRRSVTVLTSSAIAIGMYAGDKVIYLTYGTTGNGHPSYPREAASEVPRQSYNLASDKNSKY
jgi:hypothetical protein